MGNNQRLIGANPGRCRAVITGSIPVLADMKNISDSRWSTYKQIVSSIVNGDMRQYKAQNELYQVLMNLQAECTIEDDPVVYEYVIKASRYGKQMAYYMVTAAGSNEAAQAHYDLYWKYMLFEAQHHQVDSGLIYLEKNRQPKDRFYEPRRKVFMKHGIIQGFQDLIDDKIDFFAVSLPPGTGKLLADDTPVLTTKGWKKHGELAVGDFVYGMDGRAKKVLHVFPKDYADFEVEFTNGEKIRCHGNHEWLVYNRHKQKQMLMDTKTMYEDEIDHGEPGKRGHRHMFMIPAHEQFDGDTEYIPCRLERKRIYEYGKQRRVAIKSIKRIDPVRGNCIQVEGGMYCVGRQMIPTHNSTIEIFVLALVGGWYPNDFNLSSAHSSILTRSLYDGIMEIIGDPVEYTWHEIFPTAKVQGTNAKETTINLDRPGRFKTWTMRSIDGSLTGATRANRFLTADDLVSGIEEALNKNRLETLWGKVTNDLFSRMLDGCKRLFFATRWSTADPIGKMYDMYHTNPRARFIAVPALDENGESNFMYDVNPFSKEYFLMQQRAMDEISFNALYQQKPIEREGLLFPPSKLRRFFRDKAEVPEEMQVFTVIPNRDPDAIWAVCDTKDKGSDFQSMPIVYQFGEDFYIFDVVFDDTADYDILDRKTADMLIYHNPHIARFESNSAGGRVADNIEKMIKGECRTQIETKYTTANKETKILVNSDWIIKHCLFLDPACYVSNSDYGKFMGNICSYTTRAKVPHDDAPDSLAQFSELIAEKLGRNRKTKIVQMPF